MTLFDRIRELYEEGSKKMAQDPLHFPAGATFVPLATGAVYLWLLWSITDIVVTTRAIFRPLGIIFVTTLLYAFCIGIFWLGIRVYDRRMGFRERHPYLYRGGQVWRGFLALLFGSTAIYGYLTYSSMATNTAVGAMPVWVFVLVTLSVPAVISLGTSAILHIVGTFYRGWGGRGGIQII